MAANYYFQWQNPILLKDIYPMRLQKLRDFLVFYKEADLWAEYKKVEDAWLVVQYLRKKYPEMPSRQPSMCRPWVDHQPDRHYGPIKQYFLFQAASVGCKACVHHFLTA